MVCVDRNTESADQAVCCFDQSRSAYRWDGSAAAEPSSGETRSGHIEDPRVRTGLHVRIVERCATVATVANPSLWPHPRAGPSAGTGSGSDRVPCHSPFLRQHWSAPHGWCPFHRIRTCCRLAEQIYQLAW